MFCAGVDAGSRSIKVVFLAQGSREIVAAGQADQGVRQEALASDLYHQLLDDVGAAERDVKSVIATGYGRNLIRFAGTTVTEITCHARGVCHRAPAAKTVIEIGGQDSKVIHLNGSGEVRDFAMNDRCAAGTGRFLEVVAERLDIPIEALGDLANQSQEPAMISSTCVVFAETEIVGLLASGVQSADIVAGILHAISRRVGALAGRQIDEPVLLTGGVALIPGMAHYLEVVLKQSIQIAPEPRMTGALGAALIAKDRVERK
jgi:predicted CoA-substrate-specific enzyme activase